MRLSRIFTLVSVVLFLLISLPLAWIIDTEWAVHRATQDVMDTLGVIQLAMVAAEKVSLERGPSNIQLSSPNDPDAHQKVHQARLETNQALQALAASLAGVDSSEHKLALEYVRQAQQRLRVARQAVDGNQIHAAKETERIMGAVQRMFDVVPATLQAVGTLSTHAINIHPQLATPLGGALQAVELREYAGRIGSHLTAAMTEHRPLTAKEMKSIDELRGRIYQLRDDIRLRSGLTATAADTLRAADRMDAIYFQQGLALINVCVEASEHHQPVPLDTADFVARFVPTLSSIVELRNAMMRSALEEARARHRSAFRHLLSAIGLGLIAMLAQLALFCFLRWRIVRPLLTSARLLGDIAHGQLDAKIPRHRHADEVGKVLGAIEVLRSRIREKHALEQEKQRLIEELTEISRVDFLTGIANRRAFTQAAHAEIARARLHGESATLILFDIDYFKQVNDTHGHDAGDAVLCHVAAIAAQTCREGDLIGRYGGEEFIILAAGGAATGRALAERLRAGIEERPLALGVRQTLFVTASFGVATLDAGHQTLESLLSAADNALYLAKRQGRNRVEVVDPCV